MKKFNLFLGFILSAILILFSFAIFPALSFASGISLLVSNQNNQAVLSWSFFGDFPANSKYEISIYRADGEKTPTESNYIQTVRTEGKSPQTSYTDRPPVVAEAKYTYQVKVKVFDEKGNLLKDLGASNTSVFKIGEAIHPPEPMSKLRETEKAEETKKAESQGGTAVQVGTPNIENIKGVAIGVFDFIYNISSILATIMIIYGAYRYVTSQGNPEDIKTARRTIVAALSGFIFLLVAKMIIAVSNGNILDVIPFANLFTK
jgi:hypothetical protein